MSVKLHSCPHSDKIVCDTGYSSKELRRQILDGKGSFVRYIYRITTECRCKPELCARFAAYANRETQKSR